jgi:hypothetical protein
LGFVIVVLATAIGAGPAEQASAADDPLALHEALAAGKWQSQRGSALQRDWQVQIKHSDDGVIVGRVLITGGRWVQVRLEGRVDGDEVYGVLLNDAGREVGNFSGSVGRSAAGGTYRMKDGDEGSWSTAVGGEASARSVSEASEIPATPAPVPES